MLTYLCIHAYPSCTASWWLVFSSLYPTKWFPHSSASKRLVTFTNLFTDRISCNESSLILVQHYVLTVNVQQSLCTYCFIKYTFLSLTYSIFSSFSSAILEFSVIGFKRTNARHGSGIIARAQSSTKSKSNQKNCYVSIPKLLITSVLDTRGYKFDQWKLCKKSLIITNICDKMRFRRGN